MVQVAASLVLIMTVIEGQSIRGVGLRLKVALKQVLLFSSEFTLSILEELRDLFGVNQIV